MRRTDCTNGGMVVRRSSLDSKLNPRTHDSRALLDQTAFFAPKGLLGFAYWYALYPIHSMIFGGMIQKLARRAAEIAADAKI